MTVVSKILIPIDFSSGSDVQVQYGVALAASLHSSVTLLHVYQMPDLMNGIVPGADTAADAERNRLVAQTSLERLRDHAQKNMSREIGVLVLHGSAGDKIVALSGTDRFDLIVMGTHGRTGIRRALMGSVAEAVVRRAHCPVLTIHLPFRDAPA